VRLTDATGGVTVAVREKAALKLAGLEQREDFTAGFKDDDITFFVLSSVRIHVYTKNGEPDAQLSAVVVEAEEQNFSDLPNEAAVEVGGFLRMLPMPADAMLPASLADVFLSPHAGLAVGAEARSCQFVLALVASGEKSRFQKYGEGFRMLTQNIVDCVSTSADSGAAQPAKENELVSICTLQNMPAFRMDPPKTGDKQQHALIVISNVTVQGDGKKQFMVERVQLVAPNDVASTLRMLKKMMQQTKAMQFLGNAGTKHQWNDPTATPSPWTTKKARRLSVSPTATSLPDEL